MYLFLDEATSVWDCSWEQMHSNLRGCVYDHEQIACWNCLSSHAQVPHLSFCHPTVGPMAIALHISVTMVQHSWARMKADTAALVAHRILSVFPCIYTYSVVYVCVCVSFSLPPPLPLFLPRNEQHLVIFLAAQSPVTLSPYLIHLFISSLSSPVLWTAGLSPLSSYTSSILFTSRVPLFSTPPPLSLCLLSSSCASFTAPLLLLPPPPITHTYTLTAFLLIIAACCLRPKRSPFGPLPTLHMCIDHVYGQMFIDWEAHADPHQPLFSTQCCATSLWRQHHVWERQWESADDSHSWGEGTREDDKC